MGRKRSKTNDKKTMEGEDNNKEEEEVEMQQEVQEEEEKKKTQKEAQNKWNDRRQGIRRKFTTERQVEEGETEGIWR